jgi:hypothetical protein
MSFSEVLEAVKALPREDKLQLMQALRQDVELTPEEELCAKLGIKSGGLCEVWFPESNAEAAAAAMDALRSGSA